MGIQYRTQYLKNNWEKSIKKGMRKTTLESIIPMKSSEFECGTSQSSFYHYYLKDGTILYCRFYNPKSDSKFIADLRIKYDVIDWKLSQYIIKKINSNKKIQWTEYSH